MDLIGAERAVEPRLAAALAAGIDPLVLVAPLAAPGEGVAGGGFAIVEANAAAASLLGRTVCDLAGCRLEPLLPEAWRAGLAKTLERVGQIGGVTEREFEDGGRVWRERVAAAGGVLAVVWREIGFPGRAGESERWLLSEEKFTKAFRNSPDVISISTLDEGRYVDVNGAFERVLGFPCDEVIGRTAFEIGLWIDHDDRRHMIERLRSEGRVDNFEGSIRVKLARQL